MIIGIAFRRWIAYKMETDPFWQTGAEVVFSGGTACAALCRLQIIIAQISRYYYDRIE